MRGGTQTHAACLFASALLPACVAATRAGAVPDAAHDAGVARVLGLAPQAWRSLDLLAGGLCQWVPLGTCASRAALGGALVAAACGATLYFLARSLLQACAATLHLGYVVAAIGAMAAILAPPWQIEAAAVGGSVVGAALVLSAVAGAVRVAFDGSARVCTQAALAVGLAFGYEPLVGGCALAAAAAFFVCEPAARRSAHSVLRSSPMRLPLGFLAGTVPLFVSLARVRGSGRSVAYALTTDWSGEPAASASGAPLSFLTSEIGPVLALLASMGIVLGVASPRSRPMTLALFAVASSGLACGWLGCPLGPTRYGAPALAAYGATAVLAAMTMQAIVRVVAAAKVPLARASATMVVFFESTLPTAAADDSLATASRGDATACWDDTVWNTLPSRTVVIVGSRRIEERASAAHARGSWRGDLTEVRWLDPVGWRALAGDAQLLPLWRDLEILGSPTEGSLSALATSRPVATVYGPAMDRASARHLVPAALLDMFEPEARGTSDRRRAMDSFAPARARLATAIASDGELIADARSLLQARALALAEVGDTETAARAKGDLGAFAQAKR